MSWLMHADKDAARGVAPKPVEFEKHEEEFHGLNMRLAIEAHLKWKERLEQALLSSTGEALEVGHVAADDRCVLGQWLHGEARQRFGHYPEYQDLVAAHADFHLMAGDILCDVHDCRMESAREKLRHNFRQKSDRVQLHLVRLYAKVRN